MYSSTFIFAPGQFDEAFHRLDEDMAAAARAIPGYSPTPAVIQAHSTPETS